MASQTVNIRKAYVARPGYYFLDFDYSQIEFRFSAARAGEKHLVKGFEDGNDYYTMIYDSMFGTAYKAKANIPKLLRKTGKEISLGQNYGQEANGLARKMKVPYDHAKELMDKYWQGLPMTREAKESALQFALQHGGVQTWFGRWRPLPDLFSPIRSVKAKAYRSVWNTIVQGTCADWLKIAMVRVSRALAGRDAHILLTVQDELLIEVSEKEPFWEIRKLVKEAMEFKVKGLPLGMTDQYPDGWHVPIEEGYGYNWGEILSQEKFLKQFGHRLNLTEVRPDLQYSFLAPKAPIVVPVIPERVRNVVGKDEKTHKPKRQQELFGMHPIDEICEAIRVRTGQPSLFTNQAPVEEPTAAVLDQRMDEMAALPGDPHAMRVQQPPMAITENPCVAVVAEQPAVMALLPRTVTSAMADAREIVGRAPTLQEVAIPSVSPEATAVVQQVLAASDPPPPSFQPIPERVQVTAPQAPQNDFEYPHALVTVKDELTQKEIDLLKVVIPRFHGNHWFYMDYRGKVMKFPEQFRFSPTAVCQEYLKKVLGKQTVIVVFDQTGKEERSRVAFA